MVAAAAHRLADGRRLSRRASRRPRDGGTMVARGPSRRAAKLLSPAMPRPGSPARAALAVPWRMRPGGRARPWLLVVRRPRRERQLRPNALAGMLPRGGAADPVDAAAAGANPLGVRP